MTRSNLIRLAVVLVVVELGASILLSLRLANRLAEAHVSERALAYARDVRARGETTGDQIGIGFEQLAPLRDEPPCSPRELALLRGIDLASPYVQTMGRVVDGALVCTSYGTHRPPLPLGVVDYVSPKRVSFHRNATFPFAPKQQFIVLERDGFAAIVHKAGVLDVGVDETDAVLAVVAKREGQLLTSRGDIDPAWLQHEVGNDETTFVDHGRVVAISRARDYNIVGVAALPAVQVETQARGIALRLVPLGAIGGALVAVMLFFVTRIQLGLPALIRSGLRRREFFLHFQPIVDLNSGQWVGAEALLRWRRDGEMIRPELFIAAAEASGLIRQVTQRVTELVAPALARLDAWPQPFYLSINLAAADLQDASTVVLLDNLLRQSGVAASRLRVEVTERGFARSDVAHEVVHAIRARGIRVSIDDFGTGYSSLSYLESFELDCLKIDKSFVDTLDAQSVTSHVITHIIEMGRSLSLEMVAEGIERNAQAESLRARGVRYGQGWLFADAMSFEALSAGMSQRTDT